MLDDTCAATDKNFTPTSVRVTVSASGRIMTLVCLGTTTTKPTKAVHCDGETLGGASGEEPGTVTQPCSISIGSSAPMLTDDWNETISRSGQVRLTCESGEPDKK